MHDTGSQSQRHVWKIQQNDSQPNCHKKIENCFWHIYETENSNITTRKSNSVHCDIATFATGTPTLAPITTDDNVNMLRNVSTEFISTAKMKSTQLQHASTQYTAIHQNEKSTAIGDYDVEGSGSGSSLATVDRRPKTDFENSDISVGFWKQLITTVYTEYRSTSLALTKMSHTSPKTEIITKPTNTEYTNEQQTANSAEEYIDGETSAEIMNRPTDTGYTDKRQTKNVGIHWTAGIIMMMMFTGAVACTFVFGCLCVLYGLILKPKERRRISPE
ncbi:uncharacterized protein LOC117116861 [Anneissia japonica]|uniref:uncharacterized protein LOC117116861 n=1 Tax=Anneissia japonica TaxID=1529436 RepID=UPI0014258648|nr:uncharacterized protein LOC117116861 [Anneissia japonica]